MTLNRIRSKIDKHLRSNPNGFWPGRSTTAHMLALRRLIDHEGVKSHNLKAFLVFTDFKKAFDSVHEGRMLQILRAYDIPEKQIDAIGLLYQGTKARTPDGETDFFEIQAGVLQGGTLAPYIFAIVLDYAMRRAIDGREEELGFKVDRRRSRRHHPVVIADRDFADDIGITTEEIHQTQEMLASVELEAAKSDFILILRRRK